MGNKEEWMKYTYLQLPTPSFFHSFTTTKI